ncbi:hypothetical protein [Rheinheimera sp.]|jgi:hypothetical protein|uniref:hypothetical protein n=1 Tax=Rheinheimera sp. TaxID=1869214 RepID=UPI00263125EE|nr:hypothetical protein [Rheinheimera sp.]MCA1929577.1 hypothetical protein [Rheinheimera sp.]
MNTKMNVLAKKGFLFFNVIRGLAQLKLIVAMRLVGLLVASTLLLACAQIPESAVEESQFGALSCAELAQQTEEAKQTKDVAEQAKSDSWHVIMPVIVAARYGQAASASSEADRRIGLLAEQQTQRGCAL